MNPTPTRTGQLGSFDFHPHVLLHTEQSLLLVRCDFLIFYHLLYWSWFISVYSRISVSLYQVVALGQGQFQFQATSLCIHETQGFAIAAASLWNNLLLSAQGWLPLSPLGLSSHIFFKRSSFKTVVNLHCVLELPRKLIRTSAEQDPLLRQGPWA